MSRDTTLFLVDILAACEKVRRYTAGMTLEGFLGDERTYDTEQGSGTNQSFGSFP